MALGLTGDAPQATLKSSTALANALPIVTLASLQDMNDPINDQGLAGKSRGVQAISDDGTNLVMVTAEGKSPTSVWVLAGASTRTVFVTPA